MSAEAPAEGWIGALGERVTDLAAAALEESGEAAAALYDGLQLRARLGGALARIRALPDEAAGAVAELTDVVQALLGHGSQPEISAPIIPGQAGPDGGIGPTPFVGGTPVPRRLIVDAAAFARFIRAQHPHKPAAHAAALTGIPLDTMEKMLERESLPNGPNFVLCLIAYGPALLAAVVPNAEARWLAGAQILADQARLNDALAATRAAIAENTGRWSFCGIEFGAATGGLA